MAIQWNKALATGLDWQDEEHKEMFARIDRLLEAMKNHQARTELDALFDFLEGYISDHFRNEERFMLEHGFSGYALHKAAHQEFGLQYGELKTVYERQGASSLVVMRMQRWLSDWLLKHIGQMDRELAQTCV